MTNDRCPCGSQRPLADCCGRFLHGHEMPRTPEQLMRSRYSAYCLTARGEGNYGEYLVGTWLAAAELGYRADDFSNSGIQWQGLEVIGSSQKGTLGVVEFRAYHSGGVHHERSRFKRVEGKWYYVEALVEGP